MLPKFVQQFPRYNMRIHRRIRSWFDCISFTQTTRNDHTHYVENVARINFSFQFTVYKRSRVIFKYRNSIYFITMGFVNKKKLIVITYHSCLWMMAVAMKIKRYVIKFWVLSNILYLVNLWVFLFHTSMGSYVSINLYHGNLSLHQVF
jgi:hypothetical protein